ncbi:metallophosphoesterase [Actinoplanes sp. NBRC 101535]|uniref:metallophosphoesterase n=1 Tax=Actinoplanes sp. NBRC 101535 TaxID=3032196 RepID=UPI0024A26CAB|nr:metallophosphoesterase [Actinoplanes sp. NBRC 101535]GLY06738.1 hypothetical protein Acsp01_71170 [Actinoplanes sp. NBRC 101535]
MTLSADEFAQWNTRELNRRRVTRRWTLQAAAAGVVAAQFRLASTAFAAGGGTAGPGGVVISGRHLSLVPTADGHTGFGIAVTAQLVSASGNLPAGLRAFLDIGDAPGRYGRSAEAGIHHLVGQYAIPSGPAGSQFYLKVATGSLTPGTVHHYRLRLSDGTVSGDAHFITAPAAAEAPFTFTAFADVGTNTAPTDPRWAWHQNPATVTGAGGTWPGGIFDNNAYLADDPIAGPGGTDPRPAETLTRLTGQQRPVFTLLAGDICYANPSGSGLPADNGRALTRVAEPGKNLFNPYVWDVFLNQIEPQAAFTPWMFTTGNHDIEPIYDTHGYGGLTQRLDFPGNGPSGCPSVYRFTHANMGVISIDANELSSEILTNSGYARGAQVTWLRQTLQAWRSPGSRVDFIVVFFHQCAFSTSHNHASDGGVRGALEPLLSAFQVDLAVQGHNHLFERTDPIRYGKRTRSAPDGSTVQPALDGVTYVCVGSGGRPRYPFRAAPSPQNPPPRGVVPAGPQLLPLGQRYRGYRPAGAENTTTTLVNSYYWAGGPVRVNKGGARTGTRVAEVADWSQVRYDGYAFIAVDVVPGLPGRSTTMTVRTLADALPGTRQPYSEIDRIVLSRISGAGAVNVSAAGASPVGTGLPGQPPSMAPVAK